MNLKFEGYTELSTKGHETYFAGANTADGFKGCYDDIADENVLERLYIIKGGSGSGKSTLMKKIAGDAEDRGIHVVYYSCGSDPYSIDCIIVDGRIGVLDGTFPHVRDMKYPGATSELIDVSCFWDSTVLENACKEVVEHSVKKKECYASCYRMLSAAREINR